jgi:hypothetical protein
MACAAAGPHAISAGSVVVTVELPNFGPPITLAVKAVRVASNASVGTCVLSKVRSNGDGSRYVIARLSKLPLEADLRISVTPTLPSGSRERLSSTHLTMFRPVGEDTGYDVSVMLTAVSPSVAVTFVPVDMEAGPPLSGATP